MVNKVVTAVLVSAVLLFFYLFLSEGISKSHEANRKEPRNFLEEWHQVKKELSELIEEKNEAVRESLEGLSRKEESSRQEQHREEPFGKEQGRELQESIKHQSGVLSELLEKTEKELALLDNLASQPKETSSHSHHEPQKEIWDAKNLRVENIVLGDEVRVETPLNIVVKSISNPSFEVVLEKPLHGAVEIMINATRGFIPLAAMIFNHVLAERCRARTKDKPLVVDAGANIGYLTGYSQALGCQVFSFEPYPSAFRVMRSMVKRNPNSDNVYTFPQVVSSSHGFLSLQENEKWVFNRVKANGNLKIATVFLDDVVYPKEVALLKIDVEGHEMQVLKGASKLIDEKVENIVIEFKKEGDVEDRLEWLNSMIKNPKWKVYCFNEDYRPNDVENLYKNFGLAKHAKRFTRISEVVNEKDWIPTEDLWLTTQDTPFDF